MLVPLSWLREFAPVPAAESGRDVAARLVAAGLEVETVNIVGDGTVGPVVVGRVLEIEELLEFKKSIRFCRVEVSQDYGHEDTPGERQIICGANNFEVGDLVVVALPGSTLPGGFKIGSRKTYGKVSDGMICSDRELDVGDDGDGIMVLPEGAAEVGDDALGLLGIGDEVLDIAVTPDRGYALSIRGVAREAAIAYDVAFDDPGLRLMELPPPSGDVPPVGCDSEDPSGCDLFTLRTLTGFSPSAPTPLWMRQRLVACGMRPISLAVDVTNYVMLETGQPLHAFDLQLLKGSVRARRARVGEALETLDHVARRLDPDDVVIADDRGVIGLAGTMGGLDAEINDNTVDIALEAAHFDDRAVARMSRRHRLSSEASRRFERGVDRMLAPLASARAATLLLSHGGGEYNGMTAYEAPVQPTRIVVAADLPQRVAGTPIDNETSVAHLRAVGCVVQAAPDDLLAVYPPSWRPDLTDPNDLVEEVVRLVGYDQIPSVLPSVSAQSGWSRERRLTRRVGTALAGSGYLETPSYPFVGESELDALQISGSDKRRNCVRLANPMSDEQPLLRTTLIPGLVATALRNLSRGSGDLAIYEQGLVFLPRANRSPGAVPRPDVTRPPTDAELAELDSLLPDQPRHVAVLLAGLRSPSGWWGSARLASWADAIAAAKVVAGTLNVEVAVVKDETEPFHPGRCAALTLNGNVIGHAGELHPRVVEATGLPERTSVMELDLAALTAVAPGLLEAPTIGTTPVAKEDVALIVDLEVPAVLVGEALQEGGGELIESVRLFDEYRGEQVEPGKRSLAYSLRFRALDRTLKSDEVAAARESAVAEAFEQFGAVLRG
jgi:phenylalanyl-tRNA synthetase beta chain